jgi:hypothetical protein
MLRVLQWPRSALVVMSVELERRETKEISEGLKGVLHHLDITTALCTRHLRQLHRDWLAEAVSLGLRYVPVAMRPRLGS